MSERFRSLLEQWKAADQQAAQAQAVLNRKFQAFLDGQGEPPTEEERSHVEALRNSANATLEVALAYVKTAARGPN